MTRTPRNAKRTKITTYKPKGKKQRAGSASMVVHTPTLTRRGKITYIEEDATPYYKPFNDGGELSKQKKPSNTPSRFKTTIPPLLEDPFQSESFFLNDEESNIRRITKVRLNLRYILYLRSDKK